MEDDWGCDAFTTTAEPQQENKFTETKQTKAKNNPDNSCEFKNNGGSKYVSEEGNKTTIMIETRFIGKVIGRGGSQIKNIRASTNTQIYIDKRNNTYQNETQVDVLGEKDDRDKAVKMIDDICQETEKSQLDPRTDYKPQMWSQRDGEENRDFHGFESRSKSRQNYRGEDNRVSENRNYRGEDNRGFEKRNYHGEDNRGSERRDYHGEDNRGFERKNYHGGDNSHSNKFQSRDNWHEEEKKTFFDWDKAIEESNNAMKVRWESLNDIKKNFYQELKEITDLTEEQVGEIRQEKNNISVIDHDSENKRPIPNPIVEFYQAFHPFPEIMDIINAAGFTNPTPIQCQSWPILLSGRDLIGIAQTGTGKTLAFLLPALIHIDQQPIPREDRVGPSCLILSPTRELAKQIEEEVNKFHFRNIRSCCIYGGANRRAQIETVESGVEIIIATPGRLNDLYMNKIISLDSISFLVLDEADRMLDMGFEAEIKKILLDIRPDRHTVMTSATWPQQVRRLSNAYMNNPIQVNVGSLDLATCHSVTQEIEFIEEDDKFDRICHFISRQLDLDDKVLVFVGRKITADYLSSEFVMKDILPGEIQCIHGDREQCDREEAITEFKSGVARVLIATDVASRGLDINNITWVVNYDFPRHIEEYVHRIGRTGRAGKSGKSLTLMSKKDWSHAQSLVDLLKEADQEIPNDLIAMAERFAANVRKRELERDTYTPGQGGGRMPNRQSAPRGACFKCGNFGHISRNCTN